MKTGKLVKYVIDSNVVLTLLLEDDTELEVKVDASVAIIVGDDIFHALYTQTDDEGRPIRKVTRTLDPVSGHFLERDDEIEYKSED